MFHFDIPICPCCTGAMLHTLAQTSTSWSNPQLLLELGKGALVAAIERGGQQETKPGRSPASHSRLNF